MLGKALVVLLVVVVGFWLLTKFRDRGPERRR
jgi:hypothetical protein